MPRAAAAAASPTVPGLRPLKSPQGHGRSGCVSWQNQPGDRGEAPARHGAGRQLFAEGQREHPGHVLPVCAVSRWRPRRGPGPMEGTVGGHGWWEPGNAWAAGAGGASSSAHPRPPRLPQGQPQAMVDRA